MQNFEIEFERELEKLSEESNSNINFFLYALESCNKDDLIYLEKTAEKQKNIIQKIIDLLKKAVNEIRRIVSTKIAQMDMQNKLASLKEELAKRKYLNKSMKSNSDIRYKDIQEYMNDYKKYINELVRAMKRYCSSKPNNLSDVIEKSTDLSNEFKSIDEKYKKVLTCTEKSILAAAVGANIEYTSREIKNMNRNIEIVQETSVKFLLDLDKLHIFKHKSVSESESEKEIEMAKIMAKRSEMIQKLQSKIASTSKKVIKVIAHHPIEVFLLISKDFAIIYNDEEYRKLKSGIDKSVSTYKKKEKEEIERIKSRTYKKYTER